MKIRSYQHSDAVSLCTLFFETVHCVNANDYSQAQLNAWTSQIPDANLWHQRMTKNTTLVAVDDEQIIGFGELADKNHIHMLFCRYDRVRTGVGARLLVALEKADLQPPQTSFTTFASTTARAFFEAQGYRVIKQRTFVRNSVELCNFAMEKHV